MRKSISAALIKNSGSSDSPSGAGGPAAGIRRHLRVFCFRDKLFAILPFVTSLNKLSEKRHAERSSDNRQPDSLLQPGSPAPEAPS